MLKMMMALPVAGFLPRTSFAGEAASGLAEIASMQEEAPNPGLPVLSAHERATVGVLSDWIIPADEESCSATDAGVPEFIEDWLDFQRGGLLTGIREGLAWLDAECGHLHGRAFVHCAADEQQQMLDRIAWPESASSADAQGIAFFSCFRDLVLSGFYTSEQGIRYLPYIGNEPRPEWKGCPEPVLVQLRLQPASSS
jgi:gluconate 2-dehydrogenase gamma chain